MTERIKERGYPVLIAFSVFVILAFTTDWYYSGLALFLCIILAIIGWDRWKCDYCSKNFKNKADCIEHERDCKKSSRKNKK